jgi:hypothetical protein
VFDGTNIIEVIGKKLNELGITILELKVVDFTEKENEKEINRKRIVVYGKFAPGSKDYKDSEVIDSLKLLVDEKGKNLVDNSFPLEVKIQNNYITRFDAYPVISQHRDDKHGTVISNSMYTRLINEITYYSNTNLGHAIAQAAYITGINIGRDIQMLSQFNNESLNDLIGNVLRAYGYADVEEIEKIEFQNNVAGYHIKVKDSFFRYYPQLSDRIETFPGMDPIHVKDQANIIFGRRNCYFDREVLSGIFQVLEYPDKNYKDDQLLSMVLSDMDSFEYKLYYKGVSIFEDLNKFDSLKQSNSELNEQLINLYCNRKKRTTLPQDDLEIKDTCSTLTSNKLCEFWIWKKQFLYNTEKYREEIYSF